MPVCEGAFLKIVFSDLDGTLLGSNKEISPRTMRTLDTLAARGIEFVPCSGRPTTGLPKELLAHPAVNYAICANGVATYRIVHTAEGPNCEMLNHCVMQKESVAWLYERVKDMDITFDVFADGKAYAERARYDRMDTYGLNAWELPNFKGMRTPVDMSIAELLPTLKVIDRITIYWHTQEQRRIITDLLEQRPELSYTYSLPINLEISEKSASKGAALSWLCEYLGIDVAGAVAFGDFPNDSSMLEAAGDGVAMANALDEAKKTANHIALSNDEDGVAVYIEGLL